MKVTTKTVQYINSNKPTEFYLNGFRVTKQTYYSEFGDHNGTKTDDLKVKMTTVGDKLVHTNTVDVDCTEAAFAAAVNVNLNAADTERVQFWYEGYQAARNLEPNNCPYLDASPIGQEWQAGYDKAVEDIHHENIADLDSDI
jgi:hypothetical protein